MRLYKFFPSTVWMLVMFSFAAIFLSECKKYPDGPKFSFRSRATRIASTWYVESYFLNGHDSTTSHMNFVGDMYSLTISKNGSYQEYGNFPDEGACQFGDKHENFYRQSYAIGGQMEKYGILRLEFRSMWLKHSKPNGDVEEIHYVAYR